MTGKYAIRYYYKLKTKLNLWQKMLRLKIAAHLYKLALFMSKDFVVEYHKTIAELAVTRYCEKLEDEFWEGLRDT